MFPPSIEHASLPLIRVSSFKHLGIWVTRTPSDSIQMNVEPLIPMLKSKIQIWEHLALGVMGRISLFKMVLLLKVLYVLWHSPVYIPLHNFKIIGGIGAILYLGSQ